MWNGSRLAWALACLGILIGRHAPAAAQTRAADADRLARLQVAIEREEGVRAVKRLQYAMGHDLEAGRWRALGPLFSVRAVGRFSDGNVEGAAALVRYFMAEAGREGEGLAGRQLNEHLLLQPIVTLGPDGRTAKATWHEVAMTGRLGGAASWSGGIWENDYVQEDGAWRISALRFFRQYQGGYGDPGFKAPARWDIPYHFQAAHVGVTIPPSALEPKPGTAPRAADLERRAQHLADETAVANLQHAFGYYLDRKLWDDAADLFTREGRLRLGDERGAVGTAGVHAALAAAFGGPGLKRGEMFDHILLGTVVALSPRGDHAWAQTTSLGMIGQTGQGARWELETFETAFVRQGGVWKLGSVRFRPRMVADYDKGSANDAGVAGMSHEPLSLADPGRISSWPAAGASKAGSIEEAESLTHAAIAVDAVENLNSAYGYYIDEGDWDGMADIYARGGSKEISGVGVYVGPERIREVLKLRGPNGGRSPRFYTIHQLTQPVIHVSDDGLSAKARLRLFQLGGAVDGSSGAWIGGIYENTAVFEDGEWKFGVQDLHHIYNASYRGGWARVAEPGDRGGPRSSGIADKLPPDRPIRVQRQFAFPDIVEPAFHYRNPVTGRSPAELLP